MDYVVLAVILLVVGCVVAYKKVPAFKDAVDALKDKLKKKPEVAAPNSGTTVPNVSTVPVGTAAPATPTVAPPGTAASTAAYYPTPDNAAYRDGLVDKFNQQQGQQLTAVDGQIVPTPGEFNVSGSKIKVFSSYRGRVEFSVSPKGLRPNMVFVTINGKTFSGVNGYAGDFVDVDGSYEIIVEHTQATTSWVVLLAK